MSDKKCMITAEQEGKGGDFASCVVMTQNEIDIRHEFIEDQIGVFTLYIRLNWYVSHDMIVSLCPCLGEGAYGSINRVFSGIGFKFMPKWDLIVPQIFVPSEAQQLVFMTSW